MKLSNMRKFAVVAALVLMMQTNPAPAAVPDPTYRGSSAVLATVGQRTISESDLYLFNLMTGRDALVAKGWQKAAESGDFVQLAKVRVELQNMITAQMLAASPGAKSPLAMAAGTKGARLLAGEVAKVVWMDESLANSVAIHEEDIAYEFRKNWREYALPETLRLRRLRIPVEEPVSAGTVDAARDKARALAEQARLEGGLMQILDAHPEYVADQGSREVIIERGETRTDPQLQQALFALRVSQISDPIEAGNAIYVYELLERGEARIPSIAEVRGDITAQLNENYIPQVFAYRVAKAARKSRAINRGNMYRFLPEDVELLSVRNFNMTKGEFAELFPRITGPEDAPRVRAISAAVNHMLVGEIVTQELEKDRAANSTMYAQALKIADTWISAEQVRAKAIAEADPTEEEVVAAIEENREKITPKGAKLLWKFALEPRRTRGMSEGEKSTMRVVSAGVLADYTRQARQQLLEREQIAGKLILESPDPVIANLPPPPDESLKIDFKKLGAFEPAVALEDIGVDLSEYSPGEFTPIVERLDGGAVCYYIGGELPPRVLDEEELLAAARTWLIDRAADAPIEKRIEEMEESGSIRYSFTTTGAVK
jgi:hypothetical protein